MRFYDREEQLETLREMRKLSYNGYSRLTVVTGRRRIGKTTLIKEAYQDEPIAFGEDRQPKILGARCVGCHLCRLVCPTGAIGMSKRVPKRE